MNRSVLAAAMLLATLFCSPALACEGIKALQGLQPLRLSNGTQVSIQSGCFTASPWTESLDMPAAIVLDVTQAADFDNGVPVGASAEWLFVWMVGDSTGVKPTKPLWSRSELSGGLTIPAGYDRVRRLPWAIKWRGSVTNTLSRQVLAGGWPSPKVLYTDVDTGSQYIVLLDGQANTWTDVDLSSVLPPNARMVTLLVQQEGPGTAQIRTPNAGAGITVGTIPTTNTFLRAFLDLATSSDGKIQYVVYGGKLRIWVQGWTNSETY